MKVTIINQKGEWKAPWTDALRKEVEQNDISETVGERLLLETDELKVWSIHLPAGASLPFHKHTKRYFYTAITEGKSRSFYQDGSVVETEYNKNDEKYFNELSQENFFVHNLENIGTTTLVFTTIEFKD